MVEKVLIIPVLVAFFVTLFLIPSWIRKSKGIGLVWPDMNKFKPREVAGSGGVVVVLGFITGVLFYVAYNVFYLNLGDGFLVDILALTTSILLLSSIAFVDDLLGWRKGGLAKKHRLILVLLASVPLIAINAGRSEIGFPLLGTINLGILYPLFFIPLGIVGATTTFNFLAGFNGLESGNGIIILSALAIVAFLTGSSWLTAIALIMIASLIAFLIFNFSPAKVFPGDVLTYPVGGLIAIMAILGNFERIAVFFFIPYILETFLKSRGRLKKYSFGSPNEDGTLGLKYDKIYSLNHLSIFLMQKFGIKPTEKKVVFSIWLFQIVVIFLGFLIFRKGIFL